MNTIKVIPAPDKNILSVFKHLIKIIKSNLSENEKKLYIHSALIQLLIYLKLDSSKTISSNLTLSSIVSRALTVIDEKYTENLTLEVIASHLYVSPSTLAHKFSKELNISVYQYITKKRLSATRELIAHGESIITAATRCGFADYSCFYRLNKKYYEE